MPDNISERDRSRSALSNLAKKPLRCCCRWKTDGMTTDFYPFDTKFLGETATRIINEVKGVNRVVYDVTSKPAGTIEWE